MLSLENDRAVLRQHLAMRYSWQELKTLSFDLGFDPENIPGDTKDAFSRELVMSAERHDLLKKLRVACDSRSSPASAPAVITPQTSMPLIDFDFHAYVSYANASALDADWVWHKLLPQLNAAALRVAVS